MKDKRKNETPENIEIFMEKYKRQLQKILPEKKTFRNRKEFIEAHQKLVKHIAKHFIARGLNLSELTKAGNKGLRLYTAKNEQDFRKRMEIQKLKPDTIATPSWFIRQAITTVLIDHSRKKGS